MIKLYDGPYELIRTSALHPIHSERKEEIPRNIRRFFSLYCRPREASFILSQKTKTINSPSVSFKESIDCALCKNKELIRFKLSVI